MIQNNSIYLWQQKHNYEPESHWKTVNCYTSYEDAYREMNDFTRNNLYVMHTKSGSSFITNRIITKVNQ